MAQTHPTVTASFDERAGSASHPLTSYLLRLMDVKASNLCLSADVSSARELLSLADRIGPSIVVFKTHHDVVSNWDHTPSTGTGARLAALARKHGFLIFEDRKFGDIGNTVQLQYTGGTARIIEWAHIVNVNMVPGPATVSSLAEAAARWKERYPYEVKTLVSVGTPKMDTSDDDDGDGDGDGDDDDDDDNDGNDDDDDDNNNIIINNSSNSKKNRNKTKPKNNTTAAETDETTAEGDPSHASIYFARNQGRKGSIVSITTVTQSYEPASSPRGSGAILEGDEQAFPGIEDAPVERGLLILAQMSSEGNFMTRDYTRACVEVARQNKSFVMGFVSQESLNSEPDDSFIHMTPGCQLPPQDHANGYVAGDGKGQHYNTPRKLVEGAGVDIVIVGRGILQADEPQKEAERYRREAWRAYLSRIHDNKEEAE